MQVNLLLLVDCEKRIYHCNHIYACHAKSINIFYRYVHMYAYITLSPRTHTQACRVVGNARAAKYSLTNQSCRLRAMCVGVCEKG